MRKILKNMRNLMLAVFMIIIFPCMSVMADENTIHSYIFVLDDCSWDEAYQHALDKGGYLARINSFDEWIYVIDKIESSGYETGVFFLGGRRENNSHEYHWVDSNNKPMGDVINVPEYWANQYFLSGEPSYEDRGITENSLVMFYYKEVDRWVLNDEPNNPIANAPALSGRLGYIVEYEDKESSTTDEFENTEDSDFFTLDDDESTGSSIDDDSIIGKWILNPDDSLETYVFGFFKDGFFTYSNCWLTVKGQTRILKLSDNKASWWRNGTFFHAEYENDNEINGFDFYYDPLNDVLHFSNGNAVRWTSDTKIEEFLYEGEKGH